jgi:archaeosine synthase
MFEAKRRAGCGRSGLLSGEGWQLHTPNLLHISSPRFGPRYQTEAVLEPSEDGQASGVLVDGKPALAIPQYPRSVAAPNRVTLPMLKDRTCVIGPETGAEEIIPLRGQVDLFVLNNSIDLYQSTRTFIDTLVRVREAMGYQSALYTPALATPNNLALLVYMGIDLLDTLRVSLLSRQGYFLTCDGSWPETDIRGETCSCVACADAEPGHDRLLGHNLLALQSELHRARTRLLRGDIREFAEYRAKSSPRLVELLRHLDKRHYPFQEQRFPIVSGEFRATTRLSLERPDVVRFRSRISSRYRKPATPFLLVLLPCSARKPYSTSRSHSLFRRAIKDSGADILVHELVVTSPLGLVPRELELFYPAQHYDIPVTGHWYEDEVQMINRMLKEYIKNNNYRAIINHLGDLGDMVQGIDCETTGAGGPTSEEALANLTRVLSEYAGGAENPDWKTRTLEELGSVARFQFGDGAEGFFGGCGVRGRYPSLRIFKGEEQVASLSSRTGQLIPTLEGARLLAENRLCCVEIYDFKPEGNLFAVGVRDASQEIRVGDEVVITREGEIVATGTARMCAAEMVQSGRGEAVRIRHRAE